jgi:RHS repeat-associated protein
VQNVQYDFAGRPTSLQRFIGTEAYILPSAGELLVFAGLANASYGANWNMTSGAGATLAYDEANRIVSATETSGGTEYYAYAPDGKRMFRMEADGVTEEWMLWGARGEKLGTFAMVYNEYVGDDQHPYQPVVSPTLWFAGRKIWEGTGAPAADRLGTTVPVYPYGDEITPTANGVTKFATYLRDSFTGLDYADQRYYASGYGRFNTADKSTGSARLGIPGTWNRYAYVGGDPINLNDPSGLDPYCGPNMVWDGEGCTDGSGSEPPPTGCFVACEPPPPDPDPGPDPGPQPAPSQPPPQPTCEDKLVDGLTAYLTVKDPSLAKYAGTLEAVGASDDLDPRLFVAIALGENGSATNNPFALGPNGSNTYASLGNAIAALGSALYKYVNTWNETTVAQLWSGNPWNVNPKKKWITTQPPAYCVGTNPKDVAACQNTGRTISGYLRSEGGNPNSILFPCPD